MPNMVRIRNGDWQEDTYLKHDLVRYLSQNLQRTEILDFAKSKYPKYAWSIRTLARRLQYFDKVHRL